MADEKLTAEWVLDTEDHREHGHVRLIWSERVQRLDRYVAQQLAEQKAEHEREVEQLRNALEAAKRVIKDLSDAGQKQCCDIADLKREHEALQRVWAWR